MSLVVDWAYPIALCNHYVMRQPNHPPRILYSYKVVKGHKSLEVTGGSVVRGGTIPYHSNTELPPLIVQDPIVLGFPPVLMGMTTVINI